MLGLYLERSRSVKFLLVCRGLVGAGGGAFAHRFSFEMELVGAVHEPVEDGVGEGRIAEVVVPMLNRKLAGDERGAGADTIVEQFEQVGALARAHRGDGEVVDQDEVDFSDGGEALAEAAVGVADAEFVEQPRRAQVKRGQPLPTGLLRECASQKRLPAAGGAVDQEILRLADPVAAGEAGQLLRSRPRRAR